ncbi:hypothetical protein IEQ34_011141 [Dendrobium chrysotoxum]|uniref:Uncharacterized protein n=1 Tax=Dendrobium chrysotoxum TaxID=161865 RepID=A0AAV7GXL4_DENCH|nr:hypothetical protein IEQ34_011141 [Dendrobium chrysotoxum]
MSGDYLSSRNPAVRGDPVAPPYCERRLNRGARADNAASTITGDSLIVLHKKFHIPNDVVMAVPKRYNPVGLPPPGVVLSTPIELIKILVRCGITLSQFSYRAMSVMMGLIALFRYRGAVLTPEHLSRMG